MLRLRYIGNIPYTLYAVCGENNLLLNCSIVPNTRATSSDGYSECVYAKAISYTCKVLKKANYCTLMAVGAKFSAYTLSVSAQSITKTTSHSFLTTRVVHQ